MDVDASLTTTASPEAVFDVVSDLTTYPSWLDIVAAVVPEERAPDDDPAWTVDLRGQIGPLRRSKRLRMVRRGVDRPSAVRFERAETDGRQHSPWVMASTIRPGVGGTDVTISLHYGGQLWAPLLDRILEDEIQGSRRRLRALLGDDG